MECKRAEPRGHGGPGGPGGPGGNFNQMQQRGFGPNMGGGGGCGPNMGGGFNQGLNQYNQGMGNYGQQGESLPLLSPKGSYLLRGVYIWVVNLKRFTKGMGVS